MEALVFETPGEIDLRSFTMFGINAKPNSQNPIGYFGTGLKYATAVLCRLGGNVTVVTGGRHYVFYSKQTKFRDKKFDVIRMKRRADPFSRWRYQELPYTTEFGKSWEPWQAFRELESNTRDEGGETYLVDQFNPNVNSEMYGPRRTYIIVTQPELIDAFRGMDNIFLPAHLDEREGSGIVEIYNQPTKHVYYRGLRVMDLDKPAMYTYNFVCGMDLTEDRTLKYPFMATYYIVRHIMNSTDRQLIETVLDMDEQKQWEGALEFDNVNEPAGSTFVAAVGERKAKSVALPSRVGTFYDRYYGVRDTDEFIDIRMKKSEWEAVLTVMNHLGFENPPDALEEQTNYSEAWTKLKGSIENEIKQKEGDENDGIPF